MNANVGTAITLAVAVGVYILHYIIYHFWVANTWFAATVALGVGVFFAASAGSEFASSNEGGPDG